LHDVLLLQLFSDFGIGIEKQQPQSGGLFRLRMLKL
jgi:hypothetical protein